MNQICESLLFAVSLIFTIFFIKAPIAFKWDVSLADLNLYVLPGYESTY